MWGKTKEDIGVDNGVGCLKSPSTTQKTPLLQSYKSSRGIRLMCAIVSKHATNSTAPSCSKENYMNLLVVTSQSTPYITYTTLRDQRRSFPSANFPGSINFHTMSSSQHIPVNIKCASLVSFFFFFFK